MKYRTRIAAFNLLGITILAALWFVCWASAPAMAQTPRNWEEYAAWCRSQGGVPSKNPARCEAASSSGSSSDNSGATALGGAIGEALGKAIGCAIFGGNGCPDKNAGRRAFAHEQNEKGVQAYNRRDWATAATLFERAIQYAPDNPTYRQNLTNAREYLAMVARLAKEATERETADRLRQRKIAAEGMRRSIQGFAQTLNAAPSAGGLDFGSHSSGTPATGLDFDAGNGLGSGVSSTKQNGNSVTGFGINGLPGIYVGGPQDGKCAGSLCGNPQTTMATTPTPSNVPGIPGLPGIYLSGSSGGSNASVNPSLETKSPGVQPSKVNDSGLDFQSEAPSKVEGSKQSDVENIPPQVESGAPAPPLVPDLQTSPINPAASTDANAATPTTKVDPPALQLLRDQVDDGKVPRTPEDASVNARSGFDTAASRLANGATTPSQPARLLQDETNVTPLPAVKALDTSVLASTTPGKSQSPAIANIATTSRTVIVPANAGSDYFYSLPTRPLAAMADGGHPIDAPGSPSLGLHGLVGGTTWTYGFRWPHLKCEEKCQYDMKRNLNSQLTLFCSSQKFPQKCLEEGLPFTPEMYDLVVSMGSAHTFLQDFATRVVFDHATFGEYSMRNKEIFASLLGRQFDTLDCHSNGALLCLAVLRSGKTTAKEVRLFGPQMSPEAAKQWQEYSANTGATIKIFINSGDPVPALSWKLPAPPTLVGKVATVGFVSHPPTAIPALANALFEVYRDSQTGSMATTLKAYGFEVIRNGELELARCSYLPSIDCHSMRIYEKQLKKNAVPRAK